MSVFFAPIRTLPPAGGPPTYKFLLHGRWVTSGSTQTLDIHSPIDDHLVGRIQIVTKSEVESAVKTAAIAQQGWAEKPLWDRV
ncbi:MAG: aldehyde dehydrogenase family protein, partial [bacterium]|nr:aldehyde dehydrogenase family protein [bacterium]